MEKRHYRRYHIETARAPNIVPHAHRFQVKVNRIKLAQLLASEIVKYKTYKEVILSRPCVYGVFSGPLGGFAPREELCVGCLRCTTQYPEVVQILKNPDYSALGDSFFNYEYVDTTVHEAEHGRIPIKGAGYRGKFGGTGWDEMWTDMSEIVRPTRDGIHGREYISTVVDIGTKPHFLRFEHFELVKPLPETVTIPVPLLFDLLPDQVQFHREVLFSIHEAAKSLETFAIIPVEALQKFSIGGSHLIPFVTPAHLEKLKGLDFKPLFVEMRSTHFEMFYSLRHTFPEMMPILRIDDPNVDLLAYYKEGVRIFHFAADYHGQSKNGEFIKEVIRKMHEVFVKAGCRDQVTLLGSGGIISAEHLPKALLSGLDAAALDLAPLVALQAKLQGECIYPATSQFSLPKQIKVEWGTQRLRNLIGSWHDQLLEILGAMGLKEARRMRGEWGRAMLQKVLEREAFRGIYGYEA